MCDRITNLQPPPPHWDRHKRAKYQEEARSILNQLGEADPFLASRLKQKSENYSHDMR